MIVKRLVGLMMTSAIAFLSQACATQYSAEAIEGKVVDADTDEPLAGANVIAHWILKFGLEGGNGADLQLMEAVTDENGHYAFPAWGPLRVPSDFEAGARLKHQDPELIFFKPGYTPLVRINDRPMEDSDPSLRTSDWNGKTISLSKFAGPLVIYGAHVQGLLTGVGRGGCGWQRIPHALIAIDREAAHLRSDHIVVMSTGASVPELEGISRGTPCADVRRYLSRFEP